MARQHQWWDVPQRPGQDEWSAYYEAYGQPNEISPLYKKFDRPIGDEKLYLWPGEKVPRRRGDRPY